MNLKKSWEASKSALMTGTKVVTHVSTVTAVKVTQGCKQVVNWVDEKIEVARLNREMMRELDDMAGIMAEQINKYNTCIEIKESIKALDKQKNLMEKVLKELS
jgi:hypothetical protein